MRNSSLPIIIGIIVIAIILGSVAGYLIITQSDIFAGSIVGSGFSSIGSCTQPNFNSNDQYYNNATYSCTFVFSGGDQVLEFNLDSNTSSMFGSNVSVDDRVKFSGTVIDDTCRYQTDARTIYPVYQFQTGNLPDYQRFVWSGGSWQCDDRYARSSTPSGYQLVGMTPINCYNGNCAVNAYYDQGRISGCIPVYKRTAGNIVYLDPSVVYDPRVQVNTTVYNSNGISQENYINYVSGQNRTFYNPAIRGSTPGSLQGFQSCPSAPDVAVFVSNGGSTPLQYVSKQLAQSIISVGYTMSTPATIQNQLTSYQNQYTQLISTTPDFGQLCQTSSLANQTYQSAYITCRPSTTTSNLVLNVVFNGAKAGIHVRSGIPQIISVSNTSLTQAGQVSVINVSVRNAAGEQDTFEATVSCPQDTQIFSGTRTIGAGETANIPINYAGSGFVSLCNINVRSINSPQNNDSETVRISIDPFCGKSALNSNMQKVSTQYGCQFICPNYQGIIDVRETDCGVINSYDRCVSRNSTGGCINSQYTSYNGYHCTGIGTYLPMNQYYDGVYRNKIQPYIPETRQGQNFIVSDSNVMKCQYVNNYGYENNQQISSFTYNPAIGINDAVQSQIDLQGGQTSTVTENQNTQQQESSMNILYIVLPIALVSVVLILGIVMLFVIKRRR